METSIRDITELPVGMKNTNRQLEVVEDHTQVDRPQTLEITSTQYERQVK